MEQNDEWAAQRARYMRLETIAPNHEAGGGALVRRPELSVGEALSKSRLNFDAY
jgi:hypothetical protein